jgi:hypothetical protein
MDHPAKVSELVMVIRSQEVMLARLDNDMERNRLARQIAQMQAELSEVLNELETVAPEYVALRMGMPPTFQDILACL